MDGSEAAADGPAHGGKKIGGLNAEQMMLVSPYRVDHHRDQIEASATAAPDLMVEIGHAHCGDLDCNRPAGPVAIAVTWLDELDDTGASRVPDSLQYRADIQDQGYRVCQQVVRRGTRRIGELYRERQRQRRNA